MNSRNAMLAAAFSLAAVIAAIGWTRTISPSPATVFTQDSSRDSVPPNASAVAGEYEPIIPPPVIFRQPETEAAYAPEPGPGTEYRHEYRRERHHDRSVGKSVAIVAGTAGTGSAIGALAGGCKGAGIGALAGGAGGFIYDRLTHNH
jgi:hypothetical protein